MKSITAGCRSFLTDTFILSGSHLGRGSVVTVGFGATVSTGEPASLSVVSVEAQESILQLYSASVFVFIQGRLAKGKRKEK